MVKLQNSTTTIEIDRETHTLIRQYCIINNITAKDFINNLANEKLKAFKHKIEDMKRINRL